MPPDAASIHFLSVLSALSHALSDEACKRVRVVLDGHFPQELLDEMGEKWGKKCCDPFHGYRKGLIRKRR